MVKKFILIFISVMLSSTLIACSGSPQSSSSEPSETAESSEGDSCDVLGTRLSELATYSGDLSELEFYSDVTATIALLDGKAKRKVLETAIIEKMPILDSLTREKIRKGDYYGTRHYYDEIVFLQYLAVTSGLEFPLDASEVKDILKNGDDNDQIDKIKELLFAPSACDLYRPYGSAAMVFDALGEALWAIRSCRALGSAEAMQVYKCAEEDYVGGQDYSDNGSSMVDPWTRNFYGDEWLESTAKFTWCYNKNQNYDSVSDSCVN